MNFGLEWHEIKDNLFSGRGGDRTTRPFNPTAPPILLPSTYPHMGRDGYDKLFPRVWNLLTSFRRAKLLRPSWMGDNHDLFVW